MRHQHNLNSFSPARRCWRIESGFLANALFVVPAEPGGGPEVRQPSWAARYSSHNGLVQLGRRLPIDSGGTGQAEVLGHSPLGDAQAARDALVREAAPGLGS